MTGARVAVYVLSIALSSTAFAQTDPPKDDASAANTAEKASEDLKKSKLENAKLEIDIAEAQRALTAAKHKDLVDSFPAGDTTGKVDVKAEAGKMEAAVLAALATNALAGDIARDAFAAAQASTNNAPLFSLAYDCAALPSLAGGAAPAKGSPSPILIASSTDNFGFGHWSQFRFRACLIARELDKANAAAKKIKFTAAPSIVSTGQGGGGVAGIGAAATVASKLIQLISPDYEIGGITVTSSDRALMTAVTREYLQADASKDAPIYWAGQVSAADGATNVLSALSALETEDRTASGWVDKIEKEKEGPSKVVADKKSTKTEKEAAKARLKELAGASDLFEKAQAAYQALIKDLSGKDGESPLPIGAVLNEAAYARLLGPNGLVISLNLETVGGGYYTRRVIWNVFGIGGPPFFVSGGVVLNFAAIRASDQRLFAGGLFACDAGYAKINRVNTLAASNSLSCKQAGSAPGQ